MKRFNRAKSGISTTLFGATVVVLLIIAVAGFSLYASKSGSTQTVTATTSLTGSTVTTTVMMTETASMTSGVMPTNATAIALTPKPGQMIHGGWVIIAPLGMMSAGMNEWAIAIHAEGLEVTNASSTYLVEASLMAGAMSMVPLTNTTTASEFGTTGNGTGNYWTVLNVNPFIDFESLHIFFVPSMSNNSTMQEVANVTLTHMTG